MFIISLVKALLWLPAFAIAYFLLQTKASTFRVFIVIVASFLGGWISASVLGPFLAVALSLATGDKPADPVRVIDSMLAASILWSIVGTAAGVLVGRRKRSRIAAAQPKATAL